MPADSVGLERFKIQDSGFWILDSGFWILDSGFWDSRFTIHHSPLTIHILTIHFPTPCVQSH